jgi:hypothetical protein
MRRRIREAYRLNRGTYFPETLNAPIDILFIYVGKTQEPYARVESAMKRLLPKIFPHPKRQAKD